MVTVIGCKGGASAAAAIRYSNTDCQLSPAFNEEQREQLHGDQQGAGRAVCSQASDFHEIGPDSRNLRTMELISPN